MSNLGKKAAKKAGSKGIKAGRKILAKIIGYIGLPIFIGVICFIVIVGGLNSQISKQVSALSALDNDKETNAQNENLGKGKATYVGVDDTDTEFREKYLRRQVSIAIAIIPTITDIQISVRNSVGIYIEKQEFLIKVHVVLISTLPLLKSQGKFLKVL